MSFQPGVPMQVGTPVYATTSVPSGTMMVKMNPIPTQMMQVVQQQTFMPTIQAQPISHIVTQPAQIIHHVSRPIVSQAPQLVTSLHHQHQQQHAAQQQQAQKEHALEIANNSIQAAASAAALSNEPSITVFVGNITDRASDTLIRQILMKCGAVYTWKRVQGASGKLQAFGFCEYKDPEAALRAIHILHDYVLGDKKLLVKVDAKTQSQIDDWKKEVKGVKDGDEFHLTGVNEAHQALGSLMLEYANELNTPKEPAEEKEEKPAENGELLQAHNRECPTVRESNNIEENLDSLDIEEEQKTYISKEIRSFRESQKQQEEKQRVQREEREKDKVKDKDQRRGGGGRDHRPSRHSPHQSSSRNRSMGRRSSPPRRSPPRRSPPRRSPVRRRSRTPVRRGSRRSPVRSRSPMRDRNDRRKRSVSSSPITLRYLDGNGDDSETDAHEKRRMERKIKEKEAAYQERLRSHEMRERRKKREGEKVEERDRRARKEMEREAKRLREFLADYDDERFDPKFYTGSELAKRRMDREAEITADQKDRKKEQEEIDILRKRLNEEGHADPDAAIMKAIRATEEIWTPLIAPDTPPPATHAKPEVMATGGQAESSSSSRGGGGGAQHKRASPGSASSSGEGSSDDDDDDDSDGSVDSRHRQRGGGGRRRNRSRDVTIASSAMSDAEPGELVINENIVTTSTSTVAVSSNEFAQPQQHRSPSVASIGNSPAGSGSGSRERSYTNTFKQVATAESVVKMEFSPAPSPASAAVPPTNDPPKESTVIISSSAPKRHKLVVSEVFNQDEEEDELPKKRKLVPLTYTAEEEGAVTDKKSAGGAQNSQSEEKKRLQRSLIDNIPMDKDNLFDYSIDWSAVDQTLMDNRIQPWITKKIVEYIGEEEPTLVEFICSKIMTKSNPEKIHEDISMVLDDEAEVFVMKLWRLLIYEIEARKAGIQSW